MFYAAVLPEFQGRALALLADILRPVLRKRDFQTEKKVILEEIKMYCDQPPFGADEKCRAMYFGPHPLGRSVLGTQESIEALGVEAMRAYFRRCYSPGNIVLGAAGRVDFEALLAGAGQACGQWAPDCGGRSVQPAAPHPAFRAIARPTATQQYVLQLAQGRPPATPIAMPPSCWPPCWATIRAAACTGRWSIRAWPSTPKSATASTKGPACS